MPAAASAIRKPMRSWQESGDITVLPKSVAGTAGAAADEARAPAIGARRGLATRIIGRRATRASVVCRPCHVTSPRPEGRLHEIPASLQERYALGEHARLTDARKPHLAQGAEREVESASRALDSTPIADARRPRQRAHGQREKCALDRARLFDAGALRPSVARDSVGGFGVAGGRCVQCTAVRCIEPMEAVDCLQQRYQHLMHNLPYTISCCCLVHSGVFCSRPVRQARGRCPRRRRLRLGVDAATLGGQGEQSHPPEQHTVETAEHAPKSSAEHRKRRRLVAHHSADPRLRHAIWGLACALFGTILAKADPAGGEQSEALHEPLLAGLTELDLSDRRLCQSDDAFPRRLASTAHALLLTAGMRDGCHPLARGALRRVEDEIP
eukprot:scaffold1880_cov115-Isochrysis_galbana.AAC.7